MTPVASSSLTVALALLATLIAPGARADPRLEEKVYSPYVVSGAGGLETHSAG